MDFSGLDVTHINWIAPNDDESVESYTTRLKTQIHTANPTIIGLSFGGMIAMEIAKQIVTENIILIASCKTKQEITFYYRLAGKLKLHRLVPISFLRRANFVTNWLFGTESKSDKEMLKQILADTDPKFLSWAIDKIVSWQNQTLPTNFKHIHGRTDKILPITFVKYDIAVENAGHLMTLNRPNELSRIIKDLL